MKAKTTLKEKIGAKTYVFKVVLEQDPYPDGRMAYHVYCPALPHCYSWGYTTEEALANIQETAKLLIEDMLDNNEPIPTNEIQVSTEPLIAVTV